MPILKHIYNIELKFISIVFTIDPEIILAITQTTPMNNRNRKENYSHIRYKTAAALEIANHEGRISINT